MIRRLGFYAVAAWVALTINFLIPHLLPGTPVEAMLAQHPQLTASAVKALDIQFGIGHQGSLLHQYGVYLTNLIHGNLGVSTAAYPASVVSVLGNTLPWTLALVGSATIISFLLGTLLGILAGWRRGGRFDQLLPAFTFLQATPYFFLALIVIQLFANDWHLFPGYGGATLGVASGFNGPFIGSVISHGVLPAATIVVTSMAGWMLQMRNVMITTIGEDYVLAAQAKGLPSRRVVFTYAARNAILPQLQGFGLALGFVVSGAIIMEIVFSYPGIGLLLLNAVTSNDYPLMQAIFLVITFTVLLANLIVDVVIVFVDPRVRAREAA